MAKKDNRKDNQAHLQKNIDHTNANREEAEQYLAEHAGELSIAEKNNIKAKNERRKESVKGFIEEKKDEAEQ